MPGGQSASLVTPGGGSPRSGDPGLVSSGDSDLVLSRTVLGRSRTVLETGGDTLIDRGTDLRMLSMEKGRVDFGIVSVF